MVIAAMDVVEIPSWFRTCEVCMDASSVFPCAIAVAILGMVRMDRKLKIQLKEPVAMLPRPTPASTWPPPPSCPTIAAQHVQVVI